MGDGADTEPTPPRDPAGHRQGPTGRGSTGTPPRRRYRQPM